ncbi:MAG TPA: hypothetical protein VNN18_07715 [Candidatus Xenobia bacterium]|nr:hypothetical protein [Candidatus Xenobia bacterium]
MQNTKQQSTEAVLAIARDVEEQVRVLGERVAALFVAVEEARGDSSRLSYVLSTHVANKVRGVHSHSRWSQPLPPMSGFEDAIRWSLYQQPQGGQAA